MTIAEDRASLRDRWYAEGYFRSESLAELMKAGAEQYPSAAMHFVGGPAPTSIELAEMYRRSLDLAAGLAGLGIGQGDVVAVWVPNWLEGALTYQAVLMLGATVVPIIHIYGPAEVGFILRQSGARVLVMPDRWRSIDYFERLDRVTDVPALEHVVVIGESGRADTVPWQRLASADSSHLVLPLTSPDEVCLLIYTSGTTADPKGVQHSSNTLVAELTSAATSPDDRASVGLSAFPAGHIAGVLNVLRMFLKGSSSVLMDQWDPASAARLVRDYGISATAGAPFHLASLLDEAEAQGIDLHSIGNYMVGAASVPASLVERADAAGICVYRGYGSSEHPTISSGTPADPLSKRAGTDGRLTAGNEIRLLDDDDKDVAVGKDGEIVSRGPELFVGYRNPELDQVSFLPGAWFRTGDIGRLDADGYLTITDRKKDIIIRGGENIASKEVEDVLARHPAVVEAAAVGRPDPRYGEKVAVFVQLKPGQSIDLDEIGHHFSSAGLARQKTPEHLVLVDEFPRSLSGKVRKVELRERLRDEE